jgi:taurine dioxygenase
MSAGALALEPLDAPLGAIVHGLDLREPPDAESREWLARALAHHQVVFLRDQALSDEQHLAVARLFGEPSLYPVVGILGGRPPEIIEDGPESPPKADYWHSDVTWQRVPPKLGILSARVVPERGGDTLWASMTAAFEALSPALQRILEGFEAHHDVGPDFFARVESALGREKADRVRKALEGGAVHPLVVRHPETGRAILYFGGTFLESIHGLHPEESAALIAFLWRHVARPEFAVRWQWRVDDLAIWDERCTLHRALADHFPARRVVRRCTVAAESPPSVWGQTS